MENIHSEDIFEYNSNNKTFYFFSEYNFQWAKAVVSNLSLKLYLGDEPIEPFALFYCINNRSLTLKGLTENDEKRFLDLFKENGLECRKFISKVMPPNKKNKLT